MGIHDTPADFDPEEPPLCPHCGEPQEYPSGFYPVTGATGLRSRWIGACIGCDEKFVAMRRDDARVQVTPL